jgi:glycosyltransferase involved in cell wall biosynthesis
MVKTSPKVAIVHEWLTNLGGSERVAAALAQLFPAAPIYTSVYTPENFPADALEAHVFAEKTIHQSFLGQLPTTLKKRHQLLFPFLRSGFEAFDLNQYDIVISSHHAFAKSILTGPDTTHFSYVHTPSRYLYELSGEYIGNAPPLKQQLLRAYLSHLRVHDQASINRVDHYAANSSFVARRIQKHYNRSSTVIFPPVNIQRFSLGNAADYHLVISRLVPYKRVDLAIELAKKTGVELRIIGRGSEENKLRQLASGHSNIQFWGELSDRDVVEALRLAKSLWFLGLEDFGITPVEAMACGKPILAYGRGGALDTITDGVSGVLIPEQTLESAYQGLKQLETITWEPERIRYEASRFDVEVFNQAVLEWVSAHHHD